MRKISLLFSVAIAAMLSLNSCLDSSYSYNTVGVCSYWLEEVSDEPHSFYSNIAYDCVLYMNYKGEYAYASDGLDPEEYPNLQQEQMEAYIYGGAPVVIFAPLSKSGYTEALQNIKNTGGYAICINSEVDDMTNVTAFVGTDNVDAGEQIADHLLNLRPEGGDILVVRGNTYADDDRADGFSDRIKQSAGYNIIEVSTTGVRKANGATAMSSALGSVASSNLIAIFGTSDELAMGADSIAQLNNLSGYELYGVDGIEAAARAIVAGEMTATIAHDEGDIVYNATRLAHLIVQEEEYDETYFKIAGSLKEKKDYLAE